MVLYPPDSSPCGSKHALKDLFARWSLLTHTCPSTFSTSRCFLSTPALKFPRIKARIHSGFSSFARHFLRDIPSARHFNCATSHLRGFLDARHFNCTISHLRDVFCSTFWKPSRTSLIWTNLTKPNLIYAVSSLAEPCVIRPDLNQTNCK